VLEQPRDGATLQGRELWVLGTPVMGTPA